VTTSTDASIKRPYVAPAWRAKDGTGRAAVYLSTENSSTLVFDNPAEARAVAVACTEAAVALERLEAESADLPAEGEVGDGGS
jgi:hypothetical protein